MENLFLVSLISSDNILTKEDAEKSLKMIDNIEKALEFTTIDDSKKYYFEEYIENGRKILKRDIEQFNKN